MIMQYLIHHPHGSEWVRMIRKGLQNHLHICMGQHAWLRWFPLGDFCHSPKAPIFLIHALKNMYEMKEEAWLCWMLLGEYGYHPIAHNFLNHALFFNDKL